MDCKCSQIGSETDSLWTQRKEKEKEMRKKRFIFCTALLAAAASVSAVSLPVNATIRKEITGIDNITEWNLQSPDVLYAYQFYLISDADTQALILNTWPNLPDLARAYSQALTYEQTTPEIMDVLVLLNGYDPYIAVPAAPEPPAPEIPDNPDPENPDKPEPDNPGPENPDKPEQDNPDPDDPGKNDPDKDDPDKEDPDKNKDEEDPDKKDDEQEKPPVSDKTDKEQLEDIEDKKTDGEIDKLVPASDPDAVSIPLNFGGFSYRSKNRKIKASEIEGWYNSEPDYGNAAAWKQSSSSYNTPGLWGQCTWFAWGRFYEIYGFNPGFSGNGNVCVSQLLASHPDKFEKSSTPKAGAVFSSDMKHNHVGIILDVNPVSGKLLVQEGNLDGVSNPNWNVAIQDYRTVEITLDDLRALYGDVVFANPIEGRVRSASRADQPKLQEKTIDEVRARVASSD